MWQYGSFTNNNNNNSNINNRNNNNKNDKNDKKNKKKNTKNNNVWYIWSSSHTKKSVLSLSLSRCAGATHLLRCSGFRQAEQKHR